MTPEQLQEFEEMKLQVAQFEVFLQNAAQVDPQVASTITAIVGDIPLGNLSDVTLTSPSNGEVLKFNGTIWVNDTDAT